MPQRNLQEELAIERTQLAAERTHLSYIRTGLNMVLAGLFFAGYFQPPSIYAYLGVVVAGVGLFFLSYGFYSHQKSRGLIDALLKDSIPFRKWR